jgi:anaerobic selenocysteine-containing dehydrogenase
MTATATPRTVYRSCPLCEATCGLEITLDGDEITRVRGDADDVFSQGFICPKGAILGDLESDPDRLRRPRIRRGETWTEVGWDDAFALIEERLGPVLDGGRNSVAVYLGNPNVHNLAGTFYARALVKALGTRNVYTASTVDQMPKHVSSGYMFGHPLTIPVPDIDRTDHLLMLGANPLMSNGSLCTAPDFPGRLKALRERGGRLVVVDPRRSRTAQVADEHVWVRPGTDAYLLAGMIQTLFDEGLVRPGDLADHTDGVEQVEEVMSGLSPERVAPACGVPADDIRRMARELAAADRAVVYGRIGTSTVRFGTVTSWLVDVLNVLTGNLDRPGGAMFTTPAVAAPRSGKPFTTGRWRSRVRDLPEALGELPVATLADEILTPGDEQVRVLVTIAGNPARSAPNSARMEEALASLDFMVSVDPYVTETSRFADVILPPPGHLARGHYDVAFYYLSIRDIANYSPPAVPLPSGALDEWEILLQLTGIIAGQGAHADLDALDGFVAATLAQQLTTAPSSAVSGRETEELLTAVGDRRGPERLLDLLLRSGPYGDHFGERADGLTLGILEENPHGIDLGPLKPRIPDVLTTASGRIELAPEAIIGDMDRLVATLDEVETGTDSFVLVGRRHLRTNNSWMHNVPSLAKGRDLCTLHLHPDDAADIGVGDGDDVVVASRAGRVVAPVEVTDDIMRGVVSLPHGFGHDVEGVEQSVAREQPGVNSNLVADHLDIDPLSGNAVLNGIPVTLSRFTADVTREAATV